MSILITPDELAADVATCPAPVLLDVRWKLGDPHGHQHYCDGHIAGALYVDLSVDLAAAPDRQSGRHPLPHVDDLQRALRRLGIDDGDRVVVYDDCGSTSSARAWWVLRWAGLENVVILDGGLHAWSASGRDLVVGPGGRVEAGSVTVRPGHMRTVGIDDVAGRMGEGVLVDARNAERYAGRTEPVDPRAGHIPGAVNLPTEGFVGPDGRFAAPEAIRERLSGAGIDSGDDTVVYCGSGVHACHALAAMEIAGVDGAALYPGSWSQWSADRSRPVAVGETPDGR